MDLIRLCLKNSSLKSGVKKKITNSTERETCQVQEKLDRPRIGTEVAETDVTGVVVWCALEI